MSLKAGIKLVFYSISQNILTHPTITKCGDICYQCMILNMKDTEGEKPFWVNFNIQLYSWQNIFYNKALICQSVPILYHQIWYLVDPEMAARSPCSCWDRSWSLQRRPQLQSHLTQGHTLPGGVRKGSDWGGDEKEGPLDLEVQLRWVMSPQGSLWGRLHCGPVWQLHISLCPMLLPLLPQGWIPSTPHKHPDLCFRVCLLNHQTVTSEMRSK